MPTLAWTPTAPIDPDAQYVVMATRFALVHRRDLPGVLSATSGLWSGFGQTAGLVGYSLSSSVTRGTLATLSAWQDGDALLAFVRGPAHEEVVERTRQRMRDSAFVSRHVAGAELPPDWTTADQRLDQAPTPRAEGGQAINHARSVE
jgi:heme-degrading monooxygenase HmoA